MKNNLINYVNESGELILTAKVDSFQIRSEDDLDLLLSRNYGPGTEAYLYDDSKRWRLGADMQWHLLQNGTGSSGESSSEDTNSLILHLNYLDNYVYLSETFATIDAALRAGKSVIVVENKEVYPIIYARDNSYGSTQVYMVDALSISSMNGMSYIEYMCSDINDYPRVERLD